MPDDEKTRWDSIFGLTGSTPALPVSSSDIEGKTILITGAAGSIGSALALEIGSYGARHMVLLDSSEQSLYRLGQDAERGIGARYTLALGSVCDRAQLEDLLNRHRPQIVFHAAAFKHVPLMEFNPFAAIQNNSVGTFMLTQSCVKHGVEQLVMVSTDKAVEPASIMGASKRIAELVMLTASSSVMRCKAVRMGNVVASAGSVLPLFQSQIDRGEPLCVTDPEARRYFLTMSHAARLLMLALSDNFDCGILVPELAEPIRIEKIARLMLEDAGSSQEIVFSGLRPGDKLAEKLIADDEQYSSEDGAPLRAIYSSSPSFHQLQDAMLQLEQAIQERDLPLLLRVVSLLVPSYQPSAVIQDALREHAMMRSKPMTESNR